jgi:hypothetical protein
MLKTQTISARVDRTAIAFAVGAPLLIWWLATLSTPGDDDRPAATDRLPRPASLESCKPVLPESSYGNSSCSSLYRGRHVPACEELTGRFGKTWQVVDVIWTAGDATAPFSAVTFFTDGTWRDNNGLKGDWQINDRRSELALIFESSDAAVWCLVLQLRSESMRVELASWAPGMVLAMVPIHDHPNTMERTRNSVDRYDG